MDGLKWGWTVGSFRTDMIELASLVQQMFGDDAAAIRNWVKTPSAMLGGKTPGHFIREQEVAELCNHIKSSWTVGSRHDQ